MKNHIYTMVISRSLLLATINTTLAYAQEAIDRNNHQPRDTRFDDGHFNFIKSSDKLKYTIGIFSTSIRSDGENRLTGLSAGLVAGAENKKFVVDVKYAKSSSDSILDASAQLIYYPFDVDPAPYVGIGVGSSSREIGGFKSTNLFSNYNAIGSIGMELFQQKDFRVYAGIDLTFPFSKFDADTVIISNDPSGKPVATFKKIEGRSMYTVFYIKVGF